MPLSGVVFIVSIVIAFGVVVVYRMIMYLCTDKLSAHLASWIAPIVILLCCLASGWFAWIEHPSDPWMQFSRNVQIGLSIGWAAITLLIVYLFRWEKEHSY